MAALKLRFLLINGTRIQLVEASSGPLPLTGWHDCAARTCPADVATAHVMRSREQTMLVKFVKGL